MIETLVSAIILCTNANWLHSPECQSPPTEIHQTYNGFYGTLENGKEWSQVWITPNLMRFQMEEVDYITNGRIIIYI